MNLVRRRPGPSRLRFILAVLAVAGFTLSAAGSAAATQGIAMHGVPKYDPTFTHFSYVDPDAPKGGRLVLGRTGTFDSLNPFIVRGNPADGRQWTQQSLLARSYDEPFSLYGLIADSVETPADRSSVTFHLRPGARFHDGSEITVGDVVFSWRTLRDHGRPNHRYYYAKIAAVEQPGPRTVTFVFRDGANRELPLIMGLMPILSKASFDGRPFDEVSLSPLMGSGPYEVAKVEPGRSISYRRIPHHWTEAVASQRGQNNFDLIRYDYYRDDAAMLEAFKAGRVDLRAEDDPGLWATAYDFPARADGRVKLLALPNGRPAGMYGIALNSRRPPLDDARVRAALAFAFDFGWINRTLYHGAYQRTRSYFDNSELAATGLPGPEETALLQPFRESLPAAVFERAYEPPDAADEAGLRRNLRAAQRLLRQAGWRVRNMQLVNARTGRPLRFEIMLLHRGNERLALHLARNLKRIGIDMAVRLVDSAQYQQRAATYDFDAMIYLWDESLSPGNEQAFYWSCDAARHEGTRNYPGICQPAADALVGRIADAPDRASLINAVRAMDRVLQWGHYVIPLFHLTHDRVALWDRFGRPKITPLYGYRLETWWQAAPRQ